MLIFRITSRTKKRKGLKIKDYSLVTNIRKTLLYTPWTYLSITSPANLKSSYQNRPVRRAPTRPPSTSPRPTIIRQVRSSSEPSSQTRQNWVDAILTAIWRKAMRLIQSRNCVKARHRRRYLYQICNRLSVRQSSTNTSWNIDFRIRIRPSFTYRRLTLRS